jgi:formamidopyrimidine-DNA glycosylase
VDSANNSLLQKHDRLLIDFKDGFRLVLNDPRKFGRAWLTRDPQEILGNLGPEPLDSQLTYSQFHQMLKGRKRQLKSLLLDQSFLAGLGNIYTDEALHLACLHPLRKSDSITALQSKKLLKAIRTVLKEGIRRNGASIDWVYRGGDFQNHLRVYQRDGQPCLVCGVTIERILVGQRSTHFCPICQKIN